MKNQYNLTNQKKNVKKRKGKGEMDMYLSFFFYSEKGLESI